MAANRAMRLRRKLLAIGGSDVVVNPDTYMSDVVDQGRIFEKARVRIVRGLRISATTTLPVYGWQAAAQMSEPDITFALTGGGCSTHGA